MENSLGLSSTIVSTVRVVGDIRQRVLPAARTYSGYPADERYYCNNCLKYQEPAVQESPQASRTYSPERIHAIFSDLKERYKTGGMDEVMFAKLNRALKFRDTDGRVWAIGLETGSWYYYENEKWVEGQPPKALIP